MLRIKPEIGTSDLDFAAWPSERVLLLFKIFTITLHIQVVSLLAKVVEHLVTGETMQMTTSSDQRCRYAARVCLTILLRAT